MGRPFLNIFPVFWTLVIAQYFEDIRKKARDSSCEQ